MSLLTSSRSEAGNADLGIEYNGNDNVSILIDFFLMKIPVSYLISTRQVFVIHGENLERSMAKFGARMTDYIEDQRNKDLLDVSVSSTFPV